MTAPMDVVRKVGSEILDLFYPPKCPFCSMTGTIEPCADCLQRLEGLRITQSNEAPDPLPESISSCWAPYRYDEPLRSAILKWKYEMREGVGDALLALFSQQVSEVGNPFQKDVQLVVPVPLHPRRLRWRGFNQSASLALIAAKAIGAESIPTVLERTRNTPPQARLSSQERPANVRDAFRSQNAEALLGKHVVLVDDVLTTLSTVRECASVLVQAGAGSVSVLGLARDKES